MKIKQTRDTLSQTYKDALKIRYEVFVNEQKVPYNMEVDSPIEEAAAIHFVSYDESGEPVGTVRLLPSDDSENVATLQRMAVRTNRRGEGIAAELMKTLLDWAAENDYRKIITHAQLTARGLYEKFDFEPYGEEFEEAGIRHISMQKTLD